MPVKSEPMRISVQVDITGYRDVQALKDICIFAKASSHNCVGKWPKVKLDRMNQLIEDILNLP